ncbi:Laa2p KNAG_0C02870 [Huiozyma naganishii CBS 8797]|uniref:Uncharacterized protein n=1 Tax=Huiozyma naganishii (strain ATCC MYA-139 / BCRC 22969 / CBS 8797 / KCTC 17520 / NBRC 10181 / NCYC 3082 / Yp74L-3) TaxID=1071383 RepID=J7RIP8_HUIN7|nr:hypothetical protein KNAG_0C02870 [Kazachstania naganishii CBS 8797]CCK69398.1 hypothetical protein KNAG_0C02870 [Kazachstania naganishii CBS 8797]
MFHVLFFFFVFCAEDLAHIRASHLAPGLGDSGRDGPSFEEVGSCVVAVGYLMSEVQSLEGSEGGSDRSSGGGVEENDDDFGNFSDASIEAAEESEQGQEDDDAVALMDEPKNIPNVLNKCLDKLFGPNEETSSAPDTESQFQLDDILNEERPRIIYRQLVTAQILSQPFIWSRSHIRESLLHILGVDDKKRTTRQETREIQLDDSLYLRILQHLNVAKPNSESGSTSGAGSLPLLRDRFKIKYAPRLAQPASLQEEIDKEQEARIPTLITEGIADRDTIGLKEYHDELCHQIDSLAMKLRDLNGRQELLTQDKLLFENVITNLIGHTQRLQRDEIALYNKQFKKRGKQKLGKWVPNF